MSVIHEIEEDKFNRDLPDNVYVTVEEIISRIQENRDTLSEDYGNLDFSELRHICNLGETASFEQCLDTLCSCSENVSILNRKIPRPLFKIIEALWQTNQIIVFPPRSYPKKVESYLDPIKPEYSVLYKFSVERFKLKPKQIRKESELLSKRIAEPQDSLTREIRFRSKIFEIIRLFPKITFTPQINFDCGSKISKSPFQGLRTPNVSHAKYVREKKTIPPRNIPVETLFSDLEKLVQEGYTCELDNRRLNLKKEFSPAPLLESIELIERAFQDPTATKILGIQGTFSDFQRRSAIHMFLNLFFDDAACNPWCNEETCRLSKKNLTIVADTGAGKTVGFLIAPLVYVAYRLSEDPGLIANQKPLCIFLYPRRDLASDQHKVLEKVCELVNYLSAGKLRIDVGRDYGGKIDYDASLMACNIEAFKRRLSDPVKNRYIDPDLLRILVIDEIHLYSGILGLHVVYFLRRLGQFLKEKNYKQHGTYDYAYPLLVGASATVALPDEHSKKLFSLGYERKPPADRLRKIWIENAIYEKGKGIRAVFHHVFLLPKKYANLVGTLTDLTVGALHNNPDEKYARLLLEIGKTKTRPSEKEMESIIKEIDKSLLFVDSKSAIDRLNYTISDTEKRNLQAIDANNRSRNFMCNTIYDKPAKFFASLNITDHCEVFEPDLSHMASGTTICRLCKDKRGSLEQYLRNGRSICSIIYRRERQAVRMHLMSILDDCPLFEKGCCWWFSEFPLIDTHHNFLPAKFPLDAVIPFRRTADLRDIEKREAEDLNTLFVESLDNYPYIRRRRLAIVSPVFEVGVDISSVKDVITFKTIRDLASYRQKTGRGGRELFSNIPVYTLVSQSIIDRYVYRNPDIVADPIYLDPIALKEHNEYFLKTHIFMAIFDYLAIWDKESNYSELFQFHKLTRNPDLKRDHLIRYIEENRERLRNYMKFAFSYYAPPEQIASLADEAIEEFEARMDLFFRDLPPEVQTELRILKPVSEGVRRIDRRLLTRMTANSKDSKDAIESLRAMLSVNT